MSGKANTISIRTKKTPKAVSASRIVSFKAPTDIIFSTSTGLSHSNRFVDILVDANRIYIMSNQKISILERATNTVVGYIERPLPSLRFLKMAHGRDYIYVATTFGIYSFQKDRSEENQSIYLKLVHHPAHLGGKQIQGIYWIGRRNADYLLASHENGLTIVYNSTNYDTKLTIADSNPGSVYMDSNGRVYYQHGTNGLYIFRDQPDVVPMQVIPPDQGFIFSTSSTPSIASNTFIDLAVQEGTSILGTGNTVFLATASGVSIISESQTRFSLSSVKEVSLSNLTGIKVSDGSSATSGLIYYTTTDGTFGTYDLSTDTIVDSVSSSNEALIPDASLVNLEEV
jgi:hypothetical protein